MSSGENNDVDEGLDVDTIFSLNDQLQQPRNA
jgi:hypothetical protein